MACADHMYSAFGVGSMSASEIEQSVRWALCCSDGVLLTGVDGNDDLASGLDGGALVQVSGRAGAGLGRKLSGGSVTMFGNTGEEAGAEMNSGTIVIRGDAAGRVGAEMSGGTILVLGDPGADVGLGMTGGAIYVRQQHACSAAQGTEAREAEGDALLAALLARHAGERAEGPGVYNEFFEEERMGVLALPLTSGFVRIGV